MNVWAGGPFTWYCWWCNNVHACLGGNKVKAEFSAELMEEWCHLQKNSGDDVKFYVSFRLADSERLLSAEWCMETILKGLIPNWNGILICEIVHHHSWKGLFSGWQGSCTINAVAMSPWTSALSDECKAKEILLALNLNAKEAIMYCVLDQAEEDSIDISSAFSC